MIKKGEMLCAWTPDADLKNIAKLVGIVTSAEYPIIFRNILLPHPTHYFLT